MSKQAVDITIEVMKEVLGAKVNNNVEDQIRAIAHHRVEQLQNTQTILGPILVDNLDQDTKNEILVHGFAEIPMPPSPTEKELSKIAETQRNKKKQKMFPRELSQEEATQMRKELEINEDK
jgi:hypothetical protein